MASLYIFPYTHLALYTSEVFFAISEGEKKIISNEREFPYRRSAGPLGIYILRKDEKSYYFLYWIWRQHQKWWRYTGKKLQERFSLRSISVAMKISFPAIYADAYQRSRNGVKGGKKKRDSKGRNIEFKRMSNYVWSTYPI